MKITHYLYNAFLIERHGSRWPSIRARTWVFRFRNLIPRSEWPTVTHVVITHGDPDHHWNSDRVARASEAHVICGKGLTRTLAGRPLVVDPRGRALTSWVPFENLHPLAAGDSITLDGVTVEAARTAHGPIAIPIFGFTFRAQPGPDERPGLASMGFKTTIGSIPILNLGDSVLLPEWKGLSADVLMLPIGGLGQNTWTMDVDEALEAVKLVAPTHVIPCHYSVPLSWKRRLAVADDQRFKREVERLGASCTILRYGDALTCEHKVTTGCRDHERTRACMRTTTSTPSWLALAWAAWPRPLPSRAWVTRFCCSSRPRASAG